MGLVSLTSLCGKNENKEKKEEKQLNEVIEDDDKEVNDEKLRRMIEIQTKEIKRILETIHLENVQSVGTKSFDEDKNKLSEFDYNQILASYKGHLSYGNTNNLVYSNLSNGAIKLRVHRVTINSNGEVIYLNSKS